VIVPLRPAAAILALALFAPPGHAQSAQSLELAGRLYVRSGLAVQMKSVPAQFEQGLEDYRGKLPDEVLAALAESGKKAFTADALRDEIVRALAQKLPPADIEATLAWLNRPVGRRVTRAEESAAGKTTQENMRAYLESEKPTKAERTGSIADLIEATNAVEVGATFIEAISLGIAVGMDATQPVEKRIGVSNLRARQRALMPPEKVRATVGAMLPPMYRYIYRNTRDADLAAYVKFNRSPLGQRYNEAATAALVAALAGASVRVGEALPAAAEKKQI
jgi:hypothetical protein